MLLKPHNLCADLLLALTDAMSTSAPQFLDYLPGSQLHGFSTTAPA